MSEAPGVAPPTDEEAAAARRVRNAASLDYPFGAPSRGVSALVEALLDAGLAFVLAMFAAPLPTAAWLFGLSVAFEALGRLTQPGFMAEPLGVAAWSLTSALPSAVFVAMSHPASLRRARLSAAHWLGGAAGTLTVWGVLCWAWAPRVFGLAG